LGTLAKLPAVLPILRGLIRKQPPRVRERAEASVRERLAGLGALEQERAVLELVIDRLAAVLGAPANSFDPDRPLQEIGLDSLMSVELRNHLSAATGLRLPPTLLFNYPTPGDVARYLHGLLAPPPTAAVNGDPHAVTAPLFAELDRLDALLSGIDLNGMGDAVAERLANFMQRWKLSPGRALQQSYTEATTNDDVLECADDEELFKLVDDSIGS
jgi:acyl carrier protein